MNDSELKLGLAKLLPGELEWRLGNLYWNSHQAWKLVQEEEMLFVCYLFEIAMIESEFTAFHHELIKIRNNACIPLCRCVSATWQERAEAILNSKEATAETHSPVLTNKAEEDFYKRAEK